jgi:hypothetical protein
MKYYLRIDIGTIESKSVLVDQDGRIVARSSRAALQWLRGVLEARSDAGHAAVTRRRPGSEKMGERLRREVATFLATVWAA